MPAIPLPFSELPFSEWIAQFQKADVVDDRFRALQAIGSLGPPDEVTRWATIALRDPDPTIKALGAKLIGNVASSVSDETVDQLKLLLLDSDPDVRFDSARTLIRKKSAQSKLAIPVLLAFLDETETHALMLASIINSIVEADLSPDVADVELRPRIQKLLDHDRAEVREAVANAFAKWPAMARSCADQLRPLLDDSEPVVREKIAFTFGHAGLVNNEIMSALQVASQDEDVEVARVATEALRLLGSKNPQ